MITDNVDLRKKIRRAQLQRVGVIQKGGTLRVYRRKVFMITAYRVINLAPRNGEHRKELLRIILKEGCFLSEKYPGILFYFNRQKPNGRVWRNMNFKVVQLGRIARISADDALYTFYVSGGLIRKNRINLESTLFITETELCDADSCGSLLAA